MTATTSIRIDQKAKADATAEHRAKVRRAARDNPDLPVSFVAKALASMSESREDATPFVPRSRPQCQ